MQKASFWNKLENNKTSCSLCPHNCVISVGKRGVCKVRKNINGELFAETYGQICSSGFDPIEKKPLYHFFPGSVIFSVGSIGCNLHCKFCQNWEISQSSPDEYPYLKNASPQEIVRSAVNKKDNIGIAYTYNEPIVWYEYMLDIAKLAKKENLKNVMVTNGYINQKPLEELMEYIDAFSVDLKAFTEDFYKKISFAELNPIKETLKNLHKNNKYFEITNLVITDENDDEKVFEEMVKWIAGELGADTVLHISRYFPTYKLTNQPTSVTTLLKFYEIAKEHLNYVYIGNASTEKGQNTYCPKCGELLIHRSRYSTQVEGLENGKCKKCGHQVLVGDSWGF
jgi:pyruvate formate lyase activating enzyme